MSPQTLSKDLLDFGKSFWASERASSEFPGIHAAKHSPIGRFGIGFFSIFMAAAKARVFSRRFDRALQDVRCLSFDHGLSLRPILSDQRPQDFGMDISTRVILDLKPNAGVDPSKVRIPCNVSGQRPFDVPFSDYVAALVSGIDVPISVETNGVAVEVHDGFPPSQKWRGRWLRSLSYVPAGVNAPAERLADLVSPRLREIRDGERCYGLAALRVEHAAPQDFLCGKAVGGFVTHDTLGAFVGLIEHLPNSAKREPGDIAAPRDAINTWLAEQVSLLDGRLTVGHCILASYSLCAFDYDPIDVLKRLLVITSSGIDSWRLSELAKLLRRGNRLAFRVSSYGDAMMLEQHGEQQTIAGVATCYVVSSGKFNKADMAQDIPKQSKSLVGVVHRTLVNQGAQPTWVRLFFVEKFSPYSWAFLPADASLQCSVRGDSNQASTYPRLSGGQPSLETVPNTVGLSPSGALPSGHSRGVLVRFHGQGDRPVMALTTGFQGRRFDVPEARTGVPRIDLPSPAPCAAADAVFADAKAFLSSNEARQMSESELERELHRRGQKLVRKLLQGHHEGAFPISRSRAHTHRRHGHPLQTVPSAGLIERPQEKNRVDALR